MRAAEEAVTQSRQSSDGPVQRFAQAAEQTAAPTAFGLTSLPLII